MFAATTWTTFFERCLEERMSASRFASFAKLLHNKHRLSSPALTCALLMSQRSVVDQTDPLVLTYFGQLLQLKYLNNIDLLTSLLKSLESRHEIVDQRTSSSGDDFASCTLAPVLEQSLLVLGVKSLAEQGYAQSRRETLLLLKYISRCLRALTNACSPLSDLLKQGVAADISSWISTISNLLVVVSQHQVTSKYLEELLISSVFAEEFSNSILHFQPVLTRLAPQLSAHIELYIQSQPNMKKFVQKYTKEEGASMTLTDLHLQIPDTPAVYCRASLVVHLSAMLYKCPSIDQSALVAYLQARYKSNFEKAVQELVLASFDLLLFGTSGGESEDSLLLVRCFIINRLPTILQSMSSISLMPLNLAFCISQAMSRVNPITTNREEFLQSCASHGLMTEHNVEQIVGGKPQSQPLSRAQKTVLLQQYRAGSQQPEALVARLSDLDGNVSAYAEALADILYNLCTQRHTMALKSLCHALVSKPTNLDVMVMLVGIERLLQPVCRILDDWQHEDDHGEFQLSYDEFGACFLLVMACAARFDLRPQDIAAFSANSFVAEIMSNSVQAPRHEGLTEAQQAHLNEWIKALFETEGISDELMSSCPPQEFYRIVGTLFRVSLHACRVGAVSQEKLHSALELILEPFLLPSVFGMIPWLVKSAWEDSNNADGLFTAMQELIKTNTETTTSMRNIVLSAASHDLMQILNCISNVGDYNAKASTLQQTLLPFTDFQRDHLPASTEQAPAMTGSQLSPDNIQAQVNGLCAWSAGLVPTTPQYTHLNLLNAIQWSAPTKLLKRMVEVIMIQTQAGLGDNALDLVVAIICAFHHGAPPSQKGTKSLGMSLQRALQAELSQAPKFARSEPLRAQILVRMSRRVNAELAPAPTLDLNMDITDMGDALPLDLPSLPSFSMDGIPQLDVPEMEMPSTQPVMQEPVLSFDGVADPFTLDIEAAIAAQKASGQDFSAIPGSADDDIFAGLTYDADMDFS